MIRGKKTKQKTVQMYKMNKKNVLIIHNYNNEPYYHGYWQMNLGN